jgi:hypothetical protein
MFALMLTLMTSAVPEAGSRWSWTVDDTRTVKLTPANNRITLTGPNTFGKAQFELTVLTVGETGPSKLKLVVKKGPQQLVDSEWEIESNYGELLARNTKTSGFKMFPGQPEVPLTEWKGSFAGAARMVMPDPVIVAASKGEPCADQTRTAVADATAVMMRQVYSVSGADTATDDTIVSSTATCGPGANTWSVKFKLDINPVSNTITVQCQGTVKAPPHAMFATYNVTCSGDSPLNIINKVFRLKWNSGFKSSLTPLK